MPNGVIGNTTDSGSVKSRFEPWLGNKKNHKNCNFFVEVTIFFYTFANDYFPLKENPIMIL